MGAASLGALIRVMETKCDAIVAVTTVTCAGSGGGGGG